MKEQEAKTEAVAVAGHTPIPWIAFQIGHDQKTGYRFILSPQGHEVVLREHEWIDTTADVSSALGGEVEVQDDREALVAALQMVVDAEWNSDWIIKAQENARRVLGEIDRD